MTAIEIIYSMKTDKKIRFFKLTSNYGEIIQKYIKKNISNVTTKD